MHILLISRCPPLPLTLGDRLIVHHLSRGLAARGHTLRLLAFDDGSAPPDPDAYRDLYTAVDLLPEPPRPAASIARRLLRPAARYPVAAEESWSPEMWRAIRRALLAQPPDVVQVFGGISVYEYAHALEPYPALITPYESYTLYLDRAIDAGGGLVTRARRVAAERFESWMFNQYRRVVVLTEADREALHTLNPTLPLSVIPNGVDLAAFTPDPSAAREPETIVFTGNFAYPPNVDAALFLIEQVLPRVQAVIPGARLLLVGANPPDDLTDYADDDLIVTGSVPDLRPYLARAAVFACPLRIGAGIKNKMLEALAMGCPVVATPLSFDGIPARDGDSALFADAHADRFSAAVLHLLRDPALAARLGANGRRLVESGAIWTWDRVTEAYEALYLDILRESGRRL
jgi:glycosyltransferase involved in cell wall biosynthesis